MRVVHSSSRSQRPNLIHVRLVHLWHIMSNRTTEQSVVVVPTMLVGAATLHNTPALQSSQSNWKFYNRHRSDSLHKSRPSVYPWMPSTFKGLTNFYATSKQLTTSINRERERVMVTDGLPTAYFPRNQYLRGHCVCLSRSRDLTPLNHSRTVLLGPELQIHSG
ncbi:hypothetical protein BD410DRAFT_324132 [Rickenella mellea]|uniref:Uncharacterized protein n=1 Tax=Rickenella mellea TaxID=50990 RepID=A0A4Y7Q124_9AGAM|nr:hypothetical protein BD410DRAFT_324132 [Rickenella mellea]